MSNALKTEFGSSHPLERCVLNIDCAISKIITAREGTFPRFWKRQFKQKEKQKSYVELYSISQDFQLIQSLIARAKSLAGCIQYATILSVILSNAEGDYTIVARILPSLHLGQTATKTQLLESVGSEDWPRFSTALDAIRDYNYLNDHLP